MVFSRDAMVFKLDFGEEHEDEDDLGLLGFRFQVKVKFGDFR